MRDFNNSAERGKIETLLKSTDTTDLKIIIILLPQGEGGTHANYDWKGGLDLQLHQGKSSLISRLCCG